MSIASSKPDHLQLEHRREDEKTVFGFWLYMMTDLVLFASLFAAYVVLKNNTVGGPGAAELFSLPFVLVETGLLLLSTYTCAIMMLSAKTRSKRAVLFWLAATVLLGAGFLGMELYEFSHLVHEGHAWHENAFLSAYFTLVGTHGLHIFFGMVWAAVLGVVILKKGLIRSVTRKLRLFSMFWHFLDVVWIFIFTIVYLAGAIE